MNDDELARAIQNVPFPVMAARIKAARADAEKTLDGLGDEIGTSRHHLIRLESGKHRPRPAMLRSFSEATGKTLDFFLASEVQEAAATFPNRAA